MARALMLGATGKYSLGRQLAYLFLADGITPILVGRTAETATLDVRLAGAEFITADFQYYRESAAVVMGMIGDPSDISHLVVAGGGPHFTEGSADDTATNGHMLFQSVVRTPVYIATALRKGTTHGYQTITVASTSALVERPEEATYCSAQRERRKTAIMMAGDANRPGDRHLVVCPGGMRTGMWHAAKNVSDYMDPALVAALIYDTVKGQTNSLLELIVRRGAGGLALPETRVPTI